MWGDFQHQNGFPHFLVPICQFEELLRKYQKKHGREVSSLSSSHIKLREK